VKKNNVLRLAICLICFAASFVRAVLYAVLESRDLRLISAIGFSICLLICLKIFFEYLKEIGFGKRLFGGIKAKLARLGKLISDKLGAIVGKDEDKLYVTGKKDEFQIKFELFKAPAQKKQKKTAPKLPRYSSLKSEKEKVRYLYTVFLKKKVERGYSLDLTRTPAEISADFDGNEKADALFACYPTARYAAEDEPLDAQSMDKLKDLL
jgi:hypothetical protein